MKLKSVVFAAALLGVSAASFAASPAPSAGTGSGPMKHEGYCKQNAQECKDSAAKFDQWCSANADKCVALKTMVEKRRERCEANKEKCEEMMERMHERREARKGQGDSQDNGASSPPT